MSQGSDKTPTIFQDMEMENMCESKYVVQVKGKHSMRSES